MSSGKALAEGSEGSGGPFTERENWPCPGCIFATPQGHDDPGRPMPLIVTFHGDEGYPGYIHNSFADPASDAGFAILSLQCPVEHGCDQADPEGDPSWWRWRGSDFYVPEWVGQQVDAVELEYNIELQARYLAGFSGGSSFLSSYALEHTDRFAGVVWTGGGNRSGVAARCEQSCTIPAYFLIGDQDFLLDGATSLRDQLLECGHEVEWDLRPGVDHTIVREQLPTVFEFLADRPHLCREEPDPPNPDPEDDDGGGSDESGESGESEADASGSDTAVSSGDEGTGNASETGSDTDGNGELEDDEGSCACRTRRSAGAHSCLAALVLMLGIRRRKKRHRAA